MIYHSEEVEDTVDWTGAADKGWSSSAWFKVESTKEPGCK